MPSEHIQVMYSLKRIDLLKGIKTTVNFASDVLLHQVKKNRPA